MTLQLYTQNKSAQVALPYLGLKMGVTWAVTNNGMNSPAKDRPLLAVTNDNPNVVYALFSSTDDSFHGLYKSNDCGDSWSLQSNSPNILGRNVDELALEGNHGMI